MGLFDNVITNCESGNDGVQLFSFYSPRNFLFNLLHYICIML